MHSTRNATVRLVFVAALAASALVAADDTPAQAPDNQASRQALAILEAISPSKPDSKELVALVQMRDALPDGEIRRHLNLFAAAGFIADKRYDLYSSLARAFSRDLAQFESSARASCPDCGGNGFFARPCVRCEGRGQCPACKGSGTRRINADIYSLKGPVKAHEKPEPQYKEVKCDICKGTGACSGCNGTKTTHISCTTCRGTGKVWKAQAVNAQALRSHEDLCAALQIVILEATIPKSVVTARVDAGTVCGPVFTFKGKSVVALPAHALIEIAGLTLFNQDRQPIPCASFLADPTRDLVLVDIGTTSLVPPLELETDAAALNSDAFVHAFGLSRDGGIPIHRSAELRSCGLFHLETTLDSKAFIEGAPVLTHNGRLVGIAVSEKREVDAAGHAHAILANGAVLRLDNLYPTDFASVSIDELRMRNNALAFARRAIQNAAQLLAREDADLAFRKNAIADATQRLDKADAMLTYVRHWDVYAMGARAAELSQDARAKAQQLEDRLKLLVEMEAAQRAMARDARRAAAELVAEAAATNGVPSPPAATNSPSPPAASASTSPASPAPSPDEAAAREGVETDSADDGKPPLTSLLYILSVVATLLALLVIVANVVQNQKGKRSFKGPKDHPNYVKENEDYEKRRRSRK